MKVAMAAVTRQVLRHFNGAGGPDALELARWLPEPRVTPQAEAVACLGAAVHGAHRLLAVRGRGELLEHWCRRALEASPGVAAAMWELAAARAAVVPAVLTAAQQRNLSSPYPLSLQHGWQWDYLDLDALAAMAAALEEAGRPEGRQIEDLMLKGRALGPRPRQLAQPPVYACEPLERFFPDLLATRDLSAQGLYRSPWPEAGFWLPCPGQVAVELTLTVRLPEIAGCGDRSGTVEVWLAEGPFRQASDGSPPPGRTREVEAAPGGRPAAGPDGSGVRVAKLVVNSSWSRHRLRLPADRLSRGVHRLRLRWPELPATGEAALATARRRLELGRESEIHPVFGELASLIARAQ
jgi:hypothetical protein